MTAPAQQPVAVVGLGAIMPQAPDADAFWANITGGRYSITDVPAGRWNPDDYFDPDPHAPDKTYSRIGGWVTEFPWDPIRWKLPVPPNVAKQIDDGQRWAISAARSALVDAGWPNWNVDPERVAVILGNAIGGEKHYQSNTRVELPEFNRALTASPAFAALSPELRAAVLAETKERFLAGYLDINEDSMPGELSNVIAGRISALYNFRGPNFTTDAACASGLAATWSAVNGLVAGQYDAVIAGGVDHNMSISAFVRFCKIGALSATGTRPFDAGADGFVMGEGAALFVLKRLADAERDGDKIYAVILGIGGSSDGKGKGITAPNPIGQKLAVERAWSYAGLDPALATAVEAHGTSTRVGDATELGSLTEIFAKAGAQPGTIALGSVKSNIGHLKAAAGTAGLFKMVRSLHEKVLAPSLNFRDPNPNVDWAATPFRVNTELREWPKPADGIRRGGVSAFGFGGTNFHVVVEEHVPGRYREGPKVFASAEIPSRVQVTAPVTAKAPLRGLLVVGGADDAAVTAALQDHLVKAKAGTTPPIEAPAPATLKSAVRVAVDFADAADLATKIEKTLKAFGANVPAMWKMLRQQGVFVGRGTAGKVAFLYTGQGSQYVNMLKGLRDRDPIVRDTFAEADVTMTPLLGKPLTAFVFQDGDDPAAVKQMTKQLMQTEITQPAVLATDLALTRMLAAYGVTPDMVMGHSLGEYGALQAAGCLTFKAALEAVSARGREMANLKIDDQGAMAAVFGPLTEIERIVGEAEGYVVIANINSTSQAVVGGATPAVEKIIEKFVAAGINAIRIPVSHAFHTSIVAPVSDLLVTQLRRLDVRGPNKPIVANVTGEFYPANATTDVMLDYLGKQVASPVQFVKGLQTLYSAGARIFVEVGPKKALHGFVEDVLGGSHDDVLALYTNHPKVSDEAAFNTALAGLYAAGVTPEVAAAAASPAPVTVPAPAAVAVSAPSAPVLHTAAVPAAAAATSGDRYANLGRLLTEALAEGLSLATGAAPAAAGGGGLATDEPVVVTGASLGLPGVEKTFDDANIAKILAGQNFIQAVPAEFRRRMLDMHITRLVKSDAGASFETIERDEDVIKLAARHAPLDVVKEFGVDAARDAALDNSTRLAIGVGLDALRDAGLPLVMHHKTTTLGTRLPDRWGLPEALRDDVGVIFASAWPGYDNFAGEVESYVADRGRREQLLALEGVRARMTGAEAAAPEVDRLIAELRAKLAAEPFHLDRRLIFRILAMGHSQFAEIIGARGPNTQINAACASTTQATSLAEDWIRTGRAKYVVVISADDGTGDHFGPWLTSGFLASGAAATDERVEDAATPFDKRRHGMIVGMGAAAFVVEAADVARERGLTPIAEILSTVTANSAFHGTRLNIDHIRQVMEEVVSKAERRGVNRHDIAGSTLFMSHETYTPARGGSASAEINALRHVFGADADRVVITNTKGFTGHAMGAGIEDVVAIKALETGLVPPVPNYKEPDPELGRLNLSTGGAYPVGYALRLAAGFGSQIAMSVYRYVPAPDGRRRSPSELGYAYRVANAATWQAWLDRISGQQGARLEVVQRRLRVFDAAAPVVTPAAVAAPVAAAPRTVAPVAVPAPRPAEPAPAPVSDPVAEAVLAIVAELTGYPSELLDLDLDLEADLGVDTVKQAEVFVAVREKFDVERDPNLRLRDFPTLTHVIGWVRDKTGIAAPVAVPVGAPVAAAPVAVAAAAPVSDPVAEAVLAIVAELTGYPSELLDLDLDLEADLGVDTVKQAEVFVAVREKFDVERDPNLRLRDFPTLTHVIGWVRDKTGIAAPVAVPVGAPVAAAPVAVAAPAPVAAAPVAAPAAAVADPVAEAVVAIVAELTGYPSELLDLDLDLEADLGVDTVKQAEVFVAVREKFDVERDPNLQLRDFPTLNHVIGWVRSKTGIAAPVAPVAAPVAAAPAAAPVAAPAATAAVVDPVAEAVVAIVAELTGYPSELLDPDLDLEADLGVDTVKQAEVFVAVREKFDVERDPNLQLRDFPTLTHVIGWVRSKTGIAAPVAPVAAPVAAAPAAAPVAAPAATAAVADPVAEAVVAIVAELTGYPSELLDPDLDLEADLGVDTVKQAEVFVAVREKFDVERDPNLQLRDFPTLTHVIGWVRSKTGIAAPVAAPVAAPAPAPVTAAPAPAAAPAATADPVVDAVVSVVAELTGYPSELLDLDLDLEADLGVDTVKQAEVFVAVREKFDVERDPNLQLRDFPTLNHVIGWVRSKTGIQAAAPVEAAPVAAPAETAAPQAPAPISTLIQGDLDAVDALPRRVPVPALRPGLDQCVATGVELGEGSRVVVMLDEGGVGQALVKQLGKAHVTVLTIEPGTATADIEALLDGWVADGGVQGVYWLPGLDDEGPHDFDLAVWKEALRRRVKALYATMRKLYDGSPFLVTATRLGGYHGYDDAGATAPMGGAVTGFTKSYKKEKPDTLVKAVDFPASRKTTAIAAVLVEETLRDPGAVEIGRGNGNDKRWGVGFVERPFPARGEDGGIAEDGGLELNADSVVVVTGAAGSIVSAITADLAAVGGGTFHLLDLTPTPSADDDDLRRFSTDKNGLKTDLAARIKARGDRPTPVLIERELAGIERRASALTAIQAVEQAGGVARYHSVNLTDADAVAAVVDEIRRDHGRIDLLLHAAGLEISRNLPEKEPREFDLVFDVKSDGWFNLTRAAYDLPIGASVVFSSVAGRFGNQGQTDYSSANDLMCKISSGFRRTRPETRGIALDWTAWGGIGMATRGSIPKIMEAAGVQMLPPEAGVAWIRREVRSWPFSGEVIVAGKLGMMALEYHETGGLDVAALDVSNAGPMVGEVVRDSVHDGLVVRTTLDVAEQPFLHDHRNEGTVLLPGVMGIEAFAEVARLLAPERTVAAVENLAFTAPLKFYRDEPRTFTVTALLRPDGDDLLAECKLTGERLLRGSDVPQVTTHFTGTVRLTTTVVEGQKAELPAKEGSSMGPDLVYRFYFHGPAYQVIDEAWRDNGSAVARMSVDLPANHEPADQPTVIGPRLVELCFQTAGLWEAGTEGVLALPGGIDRVELLADPAAAATPLVAVAGRNEAGGFDCTVLDAEGQVVLRLDNYRTSALPALLPDEIRTPLHDVMGG